MSAFTIIGQNAIPYNTSVDNPTPNNNGLEGQITSLPYTVPTGKKLTITGYGIEGYPHIAGGCAIIPWVGDLPATTAKCLHTVFANDHSTQATGLNFTLVAGQKLNIRLTGYEGTTGQSFVTGWYLAGELVDA